MKQSLKLKIFKTVGNYISQLMYGDVISPEKMKEILSYLKESVVETREEIEEEHFYVDLVQKFPETKKLKEKYERRKVEKNENILVSVLDILIQKDNLRLIDMAIDKMKLLNQKECILYFKKEFSNEYQEALKNLQ